MGKKEQDQGSRTDGQTVRPHSKRLKTLPVKEMRVSQKEKKLASLIEQGKMAADDYEKILKILNAVPDIRNEKVLALRKAIQRGHYQIRNQAVAEKILKEIIFEVN